MTAVTVPQNVPCEDFQEFQQYLRNMRLVDDRINNALNSIVPTQSFAGKVDAGQQCHELYDEIQHHAHLRELSIKTCITSTQDSVDQLKRQKDSGGETLAIARDLRQKLTKLKMLRNELNIEEIVRDRTMKAFYERCRSHFKPPAGSR